MSIDDWIVANIKNIAGAENVIVDKENCQPSEESIHKMDSRIDYYANENNQIRTRSMQRAKDDIVWAQRAIIWLFYFYIIRNTIKIKYMRFEKLKEILASLFVA